MKLKQGMKKEIMVMRKRRLVALVATGLVSVLSLGSLAVSAASDNTASTGSVAGDIDATTPVGKDESQNKKSEYFDDITEEIEKGCEVYATLPSSFTVKIPKTVILTGTANGSGAYTVKVSGDIAGDETITVAPADSVAMKQTGKDDVTATIAQTKKTWTVADTGLADGVSTTGTITASGLTAGQWKGTFNFDISLAKN